MSEITIIQCLSCNKNIFLYYLQFLNKTIAGNITTYLLCIMELVRTIVNLEPSIKSFNNSSRKCVISIKFSAEIRKLLLFFSSDLDASFFLYFNRSYVYIVSESLCILCLFICLVPTAV